MIKWLEKNWVVVVVVVVAYLWFNGSLANLLGTPAAATGSSPNQVLPTTNDGTQWYGVL